MTDKEALEHILNTGDNFIETIAKDMPHDLDLSKFAKRAGFHVAAICFAGNFDTKNHEALALVTGLVGCILRLKFDTEIKAMLEAEEANND